LKGFSHGQYGLYEREARQKGKGVWEELKTLIPSSQADNGGSEGLRRTAKRFLNPRVWLKKEEKETRWGEGDLLLT